jgi:hypothetical protein
MRSLLALLVWVILGTAAQAQETAQKLYEAMEHKLIQAKARQFNYQIDFKQAGAPGACRGTWIMGEGNRFKCTSEFQSSTQGLKAFTVSDGKTVLTQTEVGCKPTPSLWSSPPSWVSRSGRFFSRGGQHLIGSSFSFDEIDEVKPYAFKLVGRDKVGDREANVIEYQVGRASQRRPTTYKLWLDAQTNLPLKRTVEAGGAEAGGSDVVETYSHWDLDPKVPDGVFALPK